MKRCYVVTWIGRLHQLHVRIRPAGSPGMGYRFVRPRLVNLTRFLWLLLVAWYELGVFYSHTSDCAWPDKPLQASVSRL